MALALLWPLLLAPLPGRAALEWSVTTDPSALRDIAVTDQSVWGVGRGGLVHQDRASGEIGYLTTGEGLATNDLNAVVAASDAEVWLGANGGGLIRYRPGEAEPWFRFRTLPQGLAADNLTCLLFGPDGRLWYGTDGGFGVMEANGPGDVWSALQGLGNEVVGALAFSADTLLVGTQGGLYKLLPDGQLLQEVGAPNSAIGALVLAADRLWALTGGELWRRPLAGGAWSRLALPVAGYAALALDAEGDLLAVALEKIGSDPTEDRVYRLDTVGDLWTDLSDGLLRDVGVQANTFYPAYKSLSYSTLRLADGEIWLGGDFELGLGPGLLHHDGAGWTHEPMADRLIGAEMAAVRYGPTGNIWAMSTVGGAMYGGADWTRYASDPSFCLLPKFGLDVLEDSAGWVYFTRWSECLGRIDLATGTEDSPYLHTDIKIIRMGEDGSGNRWFATDGIGIAVLTAADEWIELSVQSAGLDENQIDRIDFLPDGRVVMLFRNSGPQVWDTGGTWLETGDDTWWKVDQGIADPGDLLDGNSLFGSVAAESGGGFWVGQPSGLVYVEPSFGGFRALGRIGKLPGSSEGLLTNEVKDVCSAPDGSAWVATALGLSHVWIDAETGAWFARNWTNEAGLDAANQGQNIFPRSILSPLPSEDTKRIDFHPMGGELALGTKSGFVRISIAPDALPDPAALESAYLYPNPVNAALGVASVRLGGVEQSVEATIYNLEGQLVYSSGIVEPGGVLWDITTRFGSQAAGGVYVVRIEDRGHVVLRNLVIAR